MEDDGAGLVTSIEDGVFTLTLNRPEVGNALGLRTLDALAEAVLAAERSAEVRCVAIWGKGNAFCAGGDLRVLGKLPPDARSMEDRVRWQRRMHRDIVGRLVTMPKPTLAAINGPAAGAGLSLALACDLRIMASSAFLLTAFATVGLSGDLGIAHLLTRAVGSGTAREMMLLPDRVPADRALRLGLTNWVCEPDELSERTRAIAARLAAAPPTAMGYIKENLNRALVDGLEGCLDLEATHHVHCMETADHREGVAAFLEKRPPVFEGK